jgi:hypothetical protein
MLDPDVVDRMIDINVRTPYRALVEAARKMNVSEIAEFVGLPCRPSWRNGQRIAAGRLAGHQRHS